MEKKIYIDPSKKKTRFKAIQEKNLCPRSLKKRGS